VRPSCAARTGATMLEEIRIQQLGVIDSSTLELGPGLTVITGETGAGKTMVVTGLTLLFGGRADPGRVRAAGRAGVEGRLVLPAESPAWERAADAGADPDDDGSLILARTVSAEGRSVGREGCLSIPDLTANVARAERIVVEHAGGRIESEGFEAVCLQHEIDHLDGILFLDRVVSIVDDVFRRRSY